LNAPRPKFGNIAIVDDDEPLREALGSVLKAAGFRAVGFASAEEFLECKDWRGTRCLILDVRLPGMSGIELQRQLADANSSIPIIFVTAHGDPSLRGLLMNAGATAFFSKPVRGDALLREIHSALERTRRPDITKDC
jgi:FixJ family two-component response regulator